MKIVVAGAGAGKTTSMAEDVLKRYGEITDGKVIHVITYTNAARDHIRKKIIEQHGNVPKQIKVETSHVFLLHEIILPFHHYLYDQNFSEVSAISLPDNPGYRASKLKELKQQDAIHIQQITDVAKYVLYGKSNDKSLVKKKRKRVISTLKRYLDAIYIDEAQDMDSNLSKIVEVLDSSNLDICLIGDPKQDLRGRGEFRKLVNKYSESVQYKDENHRCPILHVNFFNQYVIEKERQIHQTDVDGELNFLYENDVNIPDFISNSTFDHVYIYQKNDRYITNSKDINSSRDLLYYELKNILKRTELDEQKVEVNTFVWNKWIKNNIKQKDNWSIINEFGNYLSFQLKKQDKARLYTALDLNRHSTKHEGILVSSIDKIKGLEGDSCFFILTTELSDYLFKVKVEENKMLNYLYVALTRSKNKLTILITKEVEAKTGRVKIDKAFEGVFSQLEKKL